MPRSTVRVLGPADLEDASRVCATDRVAHTFVASRLISGLLGGGRMAEVWGYYDGGELVALCWSGGNLVPVEVVDADIADAFAARARRLGRRCSSIFGPSEGVLALWERLEPTWGPARDIREEQPLMACRRPLIAFDPDVRRSRPDELDVILPAAIAMFTEEIGYSPVNGDSGAMYRAGVRELVDLGRSYVRIDEGFGGPQVVFKAELGAVTGAVAQIQGVWVRPDRRGLGIAAPAVAAVVADVVRSVAPVASLYVNAYNTRAIQAYERVGFSPVGTFATILF